MSTPETLKARKLEYSLVALVCVAMVIFAYNVPLDVLDRYPAAKSFSDFMASWNPQIKRVGQASLSHHALQANQFIYSIFWCFTPLTFGYLLMYELRELKGAQYITKMRDSTALGLQIAVSIFFLLLSLYIPFNTSFDLWRQSMGRSMFVDDFSRSLCAPLVSVAPSVFLMIICLRIWQSLTGKIQYTGEKNV
jgi:hypothetical protein